jgi:hypothetical protein
MKNKKQVIPNPLDATSSKNEWTCASKIAEWINEIVKDNGIPLGKAEVETTGKGNRKRSDIIIYESPNSEKILCGIETKQPFWDVFSPELVDDSRNKANQRKARYFCTCNFKKLIWWKTKEANDPTLPEEEKIVNKYDLSEIEDLDLIESPQFSFPIKRELEHFIKKLYLVSTGKEPEPRQPVDEFLIYRIHEKIRVLSNYYRAIISDKCHKDNTFRKELSKWFVEQNWNFAMHDEDFAKAARQTSYLLVNKILFYDLLQIKRPQQLAELKIPEGLLEGSQLQEILQSYFNRVLKIDYKTIYDADFIDTIAFPNSKEVINEIHDLITILRKYNLARLGFDVIGRIFERIIPIQERHNLGQYFTRPDVVDLIIRFCLKHEDDKVLDPACGAGTFLVRAYHHKKLMNQRQSHERLLESIWGNDIAKFPAHLSTINLAINDLGIDDNYPRIIKEDFFKLLVDKDGFILSEKQRKQFLVTLSKDVKEVIYPKKFDAIVGNPPYTRQEEIEDIEGIDKEKLIDSALTFGNKKIAEISKRAGLHAYFFVHGTKFLSDGGHFGFIVSNSWLDVDYGKGLQEFFLYNYKIIAILESKVERWFEEADINTCIVILQKCKDKNERDNNLVRFVYLKKPLSTFISPVNDIWDSQVKRINDIDNLIKTISAHTILYENEDLRVFPKMQKDLWIEGYDNEEKEYVGSKWGKYLRAPEIFFKILEKGKDKLVPLKEIADVRFGIKTGANEFFYLTEEEIKDKKIEKEFWMHKDEKGKWIPNYVVRSPRECKSIVIGTQNLKYRLLIIHKTKDKLRNTNILKYINEGERNGFNKRPTCESRSNWYDLGVQQPPDLLWFKAFNDRVLAPLNSLGFYSSDRFYAIYSHKKKNKFLLASILNSTLAHLIVEIWGRVNLGEGALDNMTYEAATMLVIDTEFVNIKSKKEIEKFFERPITSVFNEIGTNNPLDVNLNKISTERRELDKIIMGDILGLTEQEQLEVYKAVIDLVKTRLEKAKSVQKTKKTKSGIDIDALKRLILDKAKS